MAAKYVVIAGKLCVFCEKLVPQKSYRSLFVAGTLHLNKQIQEVLDSKHDSALWRRTGQHFGQPGSYACRQCFTALNRLHKIDSELENKLQKLKSEKREIVSTLVGSPSAVPSPGPTDTATGTAGTHTDCGTDTVTPTPGGSVPGTPVASYMNMMKGVKRSLVKTPTPKKTVKRQLLKTPQKLNIPSPMAMPLGNATQTAHKQTQIGRPLALDPIGTVKVNIRYINS